MKGRGTTKGEKNKNCQRITREKARTDQCKDGVWKMEKWGTSLYARCGKNDEKKPIGVRRKAVKKPGVIETGTEKGVKVVRINNVKGSTKEREKR